MARQRYPSDEARLRRPSGVLIAFSILHPDPDHPEHSEVFEDPEMRGIWLGLLAVAGQAFAGRTGDRVTLSLGQLTWVTGRQGRTAAESALTRVCSRMGYEVTPLRGRSWTVHVKNLSRNQGWTTRDSADSVSNSADSAPPPSPIPIPSPIPNPIRKEREKTAEAAEQPSLLPLPVSPSAPEHPEPDPLGEHRQLLNLLAKEPGALREKELWLAHELPLMQVEVDEGRASWRSLVLRWWRAYLRRPKIVSETRQERTFEKAARREAQAAAVAAHRARLAADPEVQREIEVALREMAAPPRPLESFWVTDLNAEVARGS